MKDELKLKLEQRAKLEERFEVLSKAGKERDLTTEENAELEKLDNELEALDKEIKKLEGREARLAKIAKRKLAVEASASGLDQDNASENLELAKIAKNFRISRAFNNILKKRKVDGVEAEMTEEAYREMGQTEGINTSGNVAVPDKLIKIGRERDERLLSIATEGTDVVQTDIGQLIPILNPIPVLTDMGITVLQGLNGNLQWPRETGDVAFSWETESSDVDETTPTTDNITLSPKRVGGYVDVTMQMLAQSKFVVEPWIRRRLEGRYALTVDYAGLNSSGTGNEPTGLFNRAGVNVLSTGSGSANDMTYRALLSMVRDTRTAKARNGRAGWLTNAFGDFALANTPKQANGVEGNFIKDPEKTTMIAYPFKSSEVVKSDFSEGGQSDLCGIAFSPNWGGLILGTWGGLDILFDPYTQRVGGKIRFVVNTFMDTNIEQPAEFSICKDWDASDLPALT